MKQPLKVLSRVTDSTLIDMYLSISKKTDKPKKDYYGHLKMLIKAEGQKRELRYFLT